VTNVTTIDFHNGNHKLPAKVARDIQSVALEIYAVQFVPCKKFDFDFTPGTLLAKLRNAGHMEQAHLSAAQKVLEDLEVAATRQGEAGPGNDAFDRVRLLMDEVLTEKERHLMIDLIVRDYFRREGGEKLIEIGRLLSGYTGEQQARSAGVARVQALLERIGAYYADL
jgi:hypothetical protein